MLLSRLSRAGLIARVWRGFYLVPQRLPRGGKRSPSEALAISTLMTELQRRYQIGARTAKAIRWAVSETEAAYQRTHLGKHEL